MTVYGYLFPFDVDVIQFEVPPAMKPIVDETGVIIGVEPVMIPLEVPILDADGKVVMDYTQSPPKPLTQPVYDDFGVPVMAPLAAEQVLLNPMVSVPACSAYADVYPDLGLEGPGLPGHTATDPDGLLMGFSRPGPVGSERGIYSVSVAHMNEAITHHNEDDGCNVGLLDPALEDLSMYMPYGMTQECIHCAPWTCGTDNTVTWYTVYAGTYKVWIFNANGVRGDYIYSQGTQEGGSCEDLEQATDLMRRAINGELYKKGSCVDWTHSGYEGCEAPPF
jgi:hypothetical protein